MPSYFEQSATGWSGMAKVSCILYHWGVQLMLAYSWARLAILVAGKDRGGCLLLLLLLFFYVFFFNFFCFFTSIPVPLSSLSLSFISSTVSSITFLPFSRRRYKMIHKGWRVIKPPTKSIDWTTRYGNTTRQPPQPYALRQIHKTATYYKYSFPTAVVYWLILLIPKPHF